MRCSTILIINDKASGFLMLCKISTRTCTKDLKSEYQFNAHRCVKQLIFLHFDVVCFACMAEQKADTSKLFSCTYMHRTDIHCLVQKGMCSDSLILTRSESKSEVKYRPVYTPRQSMTIGGPQVHCSLEQKPSILTYFNCQSSPFFHTSRVVNKFHGRRQHKMQQAAAFAQ